eukprot:TRINITY_DN9545_c1_g1_i1.p1 TRINITY_DN9545_c1_g1~~TRINITY_DN9545_c1_g1_i1.p1  ORF type:complete len:1324 (+),score=415.97 TRINITY_DN9545_c1_g1_i1:307-4278(+)
MVQLAVAKCLPGIAPMVDDHATLIAQLLKYLLEDEKFAVRKGAAYGLSGVVKGLGISALKKHNIMTALQEAAGDAKNPTAREGALFAFEQFCSTLGRLFEPYVIQLLPVLLSCFSDNQRPVRDATSDCARAVMANLSGHGVKLILPAILAGLEDRAWRSRTGSVQLLGAMAFCAPRQLSSCLPPVVPRLIEVLSDSHAKVREAALDALADIGSVIRNPEIQVHVPVIHKALGDPNSYTQQCLDTLIDTEFVHTIDPASLALIVPVLHRGLRERSTEIKKRAAQIVGSMCSLADHKDVLPYVQVLMPELRGILFDPNPQVRTVVAKALGSLIHGMGEEALEDLVPWLMETLVSDTSPVERSGAAQGLCEAINALGEEKLRELLPQVIDLTESNKPYQREGALGLFVFLPPMVGALMKPFTKEILPVILRGLADESELVRDTALRAGRVLVREFALSTMDSVLPPLLSGLLDPHQRIRHSSVQLLGDLLRAIASAALGREISAPVEGEELIATDAQGEAILEALGTERRDAAFSALYMARSDVSLAVRQAAGQVWKSVVPNTPKLLRDILPVMMDTLITSLADDSAGEDQRENASRCLGDLVTKMGDRMLPELIPILEQGLKNDSADTREGVCLGLVAVLESGTKSMLTSYTGQLLPAIREAVCDREDKVQAAAAEAFSVMYGNVGNRALEEVVPYLCEQLDGEESAATALNGITAIMKVRGHEVLPFIVPKLTSDPISDLDAKAIKAVVQVAGDSLNRQIGAVLPPLMRASRQDDTGDIVTDDILEAAEAVVSSVDDDGQAFLMQELLRSLSDVNPVRVRVAGAHLVGHFAANTDTDIEEEIPTILQSLLKLHVDPEPAVHKAGWAALGVVTKTIPKDDLAQYVPTVRDAVRNMVLLNVTRNIRMESVPGFCLPKGLAPILEIFLQALMFGLPEMREHAALGLGELIDLTSQAALKPFVIKITGPLIRIIGDRFPWQVKAAILQTLSMLLKKGGIVLKPFLPQLQTTFTKALHDGSSTVRNRAARALVLLVSLNARVDPLIAELLNGIKSEEEGVSEAFLRSLAGVLKAVGSKAGDKSINAINEQVLPLGLDPPYDDDARRRLADVIGVYAALPAADTGAILRSHLFPPTPSKDWMIRHFRLMAIRAFTSMSEEIACEHQADAIAAAQAGLSDDNVIVRQAACDLLGGLLTMFINDFATARKLFTLLASKFEDGSSEVRARACDVLKAVTKSNRDNAALHAAVLVGPCAPLTKDKAMLVKMASERALSYLLFAFEGLDEALKKFNLNKDCPPEVVRDAPDLIRRLVRRLTEEMVQSDVDSDDDE